ncbi:MAG TPA: beta-ketoacyl synthase N-terminal-like domain-containing protein [Acidimicrobiia bacterium]|nr:beta-ketoacyl synthase N-terminal-like domain-containing protein [Acidimicrobiia bacterium]
MGASRSYESESATKGRSPATVCGVGAVTAYGWGRKNLWDGLESGESAVVASSGWADTLGHDVAYMGKVIDVPHEDPRSRYARAMESAVDEAIEDAYDRGWKPGPVVGLIHAIVLGEVDVWREFYMERDRRLSKREYLQLMPSTILSTQMQRHDFHGPAMSVTAMCASGNAAMLTAKMWLDAGVVTDVVVVATDISGTTDNIRHFVDLGVLFVDRPPFEACRPFQNDSKGFLLGEASVAFVVSRQPEPAYLKMLGGAMTHDGFHVVSIDPQYKEIRRCFELALDDAGIDRGDVKYLNAHGPGTAQCDAAESGILDTMFEEAEGIFSVKPLTGHCQAASSAVEIAAACMAFETGLIPAPRPVAPGHPRLLGGPTPRKPGIMLKSSIGMGGHNAVIALDDV